MKRSMILLLVVMLVGLTASVWAQIPVRPIPGVEVDVDIQGMTDDSTLVVLEGEVTVTVSSPDRDFRGHLFFSDQVNNWFPFLFERFDAIEDSIEFVMSDLILVPAGETVQFTAHFYLNPWDKDEYDIFTNGKWYMPEVIIGMVYLPEDGSRWVWSGIEEFRVWAKEPDPDNPFDVSVEFDIEGFDPEANTLTVLRDTMSVTVKVFAPYHNIRMCLYHMDDSVYGGAPFHFVGSDPSDPLWVDRPFSVTAGDTTTYHTQIYINHEFGFDLDSRGRFVGEGYSFDLFYRLDGDRYFGDIKGSVSLDYRLRAYPASVESPAPPVVSKFNLAQNYPNPFNPTTTIKYSVAEMSHVCLTVYNSRGRVVRDLVNENQLPGNYSVQFDSNDLASGVYLYRLQAGGEVATKRMMLIK